MKKIIIEATHVKCLIDSLTPFKSDKNHIRFQFGVDAKARKVEDGDKQGLEKLTDNRAILINGGAQICKLFFAYIEDSSDLEEGKTYASFNLKAVDTLCLLSALESYRKDIELSVKDDGTSVEFSIPDITKMSLYTIVEEEMEPELPCQENAIIARMKLDAKGFQALVQRGGSLLQPKDEQGLANRIVMHFSEKMAEMYSTNRNAVEKAWMEAEIVFDPVNLPMKELSAYAETLSAEEKQKLQEKIKAAGKENLSKVAEEYKIDAKSLTISFAYSNFSELCSVIKGEGTAMVSISPSYFYVAKDSVIAYFALAGKANQLIYLINNLDSKNYPYRICVDKAELLKGLNVLETVSNLGENRENNVPLKLSMTQGKLGMYMGAAKLTTQVLSLTDEAMEGFKDCVVNPKYVRTIASVQEGANLTLCMEEAVNTPILISSGGLECDNATSKAIILRIATPKTEQVDTDE